MCDVLYVQLAILSPCSETRNLHQCIRQALTQRFEDLSDYNRTYAVLQQDSVSAGTAINLVLWLLSSFSNGIISRELWTHVSPYLITCDFFVCETLEEEVNSNNSGTEIDKK